MYSFSEIYQFYAFSLFKNGTHHPKFLKKSDDVHGGRHHY